MCLSCKGDCKAENHKWVTLQCPLSIHFLLHATSRRIAVQCNVHSLNIGLQQECMIRSTIKMDVIMRSCCSVQWNTPPLVDTMFMDGLLFLH